MQGQRRSPEQRPVLAEVGSGEFDQQRLHRHLAAAGDQTGRRQAAIDRKGGGPCALRKDQQAGTAVEFLAGVENHPQRRIVADEARQTRRSAEEEVVHEFRLHDADGIRHAREHEHGVEQRGVIGNEHQRPGVAQLIEFVEIEAAGTQHAQHPEIAAKAGTRDEAPERLAETPGEQRMQEHRKRQPDQAAKRQRPQPERHRQTFIGDPQRLAATRISHRPARASTIRRGSSSPTVRRQNSPSA